MEDIVNAAIISSAINRLNKNIEEFNKKATKQTQTLIWLTVGIFMLSFLMLVGLGVQIWINLS